MVVVAVTEPEYRKAPEVFRAAAGSMGLRCESVPSGEAELAAAIQKSGARHAIVGIERYTDALYRTLGRGAVLARFGVGHDSVDKARATAGGIIVTNTPGALDDSVAELAMALIIAAARHLPTLDQQTHAGQWKPVIGVELRGRTLAVIGCGPIGCRLTRIAARGFGMRVIGCDPRPQDVARLRDEFGLDAYVQDFATAVAGADYVSLHIPATPENRLFLNAERLALLAPSAWVINTARGAVLDEAALCNALASGKLAGAALDVFEKEPYAPASPDHDLRRLPNVIMTPHVGSSTREACTRMAEKALANIAAAQRRDYASMNVVNPEVLSTL